MENDFSLDVDECYIVINLLVMVMYGVNVSLVVEIVEWVLEFKNWKFLKNVFEDLF